MKIFFVSILLIVNRLLCNSNEFKTDQNDGLLLVISLDGFRHDYLDKYSNKNGFLNSLASKGVRASWSESIFPTNTYTNHWGIVTGVHPEVNGIINNNIYDPITKKHFKMNKDNENQPGWFEHEPIWITNLKSGLSRKHSVVYDWPGGSAPFLEPNQKQDYSFRHPDKELYNITTFNKTIDAFVESISHEHTNLAFLYFGEPDMSGHHYGPESKEVELVVKELDYVLDYLFSQLRLKKRFILNNFFPDDNSLNQSEYKHIDLIVLTDHGMTYIREENKPFDENKHLFLSDYIDVYKYLDVEKCSYGSLAELWPANDEVSINELYELLEQVKHNSNGKLDKIYLKKDIPERFYIKSNRRMSPLLLLANEGYQIMTDRSRMSSYSVQKYMGNHGFDNELKSMRGIYLSYGKAFKESYYSKKPVKIIDIYSLMCNILGLNANANNGSFARIKHVLNENLIRHINSKREFNYETDLDDDDDIMKLFMYGGILLVVGLILISIILPFATIMGSVRATCHTPNDALANFSKAKKEISKKDK